MLGYIIRRILMTIPVMLVVAVVVFLLLHLSPGDPAAIIAGDHATSEDIERIRVSLGFDRPLITQFLSWLGALAQGDLGVSVFNKVPVWTLIAQRVEPTLSLATTTMIFAVIVAVPVGIVAAWKAGTWVDHLIMGIAVLAFSAPVFLIGYGLVFQFARTWRLLPVQGYTPMTQDFGAFSAHLVLPSITLGLVFAALLAHDTLHHDGRAERGLYPHRPRQGPRARSRGRASRAEECAHSGGDHDRAAGRHAACGRHPDRKSVV